MKMRIHAGLALALGGISFSFACGDSSVQHSSSGSSLPAEVDPQADPEAIAIDSSAALIDPRIFNWVRDDVRKSIAAFGIEAVPAAPEVSDELFELGRALSFDKVLSGDRDVSCMSCHHPTLGSGDGRALPIGTGGTGLGPLRDHPDDVRIPRNAPALFNLHAADSMFWDSRVATQYGVVSPAGGQLTEAMQETLSLGSAAIQALFPVTSGDEMRGHGDSNEIASLADDDFAGIWDALMTRLEAIPEYVEMFENAYPEESFDDMTFAHAANAIAAFEIAGFEARQSPWQRFVAGDDKALSRSQLWGAKVFFDSGCASCHNGAMLTDFEHHNTGMAQFGPGKGDGESGRDDFGRFRETDDPADLYAFRTPTLHNVALTAPYGHVGQHANLLQHVVHYASPVWSLALYSIEYLVEDEVLYDQFEENRRAVIDAGLDPDMPDLRAWNSFAIVSFLHSLTDPASTDLVHLIPDQVPSGLPVED